MPELLLNDRDCKSDKNDGHKLDWYNFEVSIHRYIILHVVILKCPEADGGLVVVPSKAADRGLLLNIPKLMGHSIAIIPNGAYILVLTSFSVSRRKIWLMTNAGLV